jgi:acyl carrier protein
MVSFEEIAQLIAEILDIETKDITLNSSFEDLGADSVNFALILIKTEDIFNLDIPDNDEDKFKTVSDLIQYVNQSANPPLDGFPGKKK